MAAFDDLFANAGRSGHSASLASARAVFRAREALAGLVAAPACEDVVFARGCTEALNLVIKGVLQPGDRVALTPMEHNSVMRPVEQLSRERGVVAEILPADPFGQVDIEAAARIGRKRGFALVVANHASNVNGAIQDLGGLRQAFPEAPILVDAAQSAGVLPLNVQADGIDFLAFSGHKGILGPTGVGCLYLSAGRELPPLLEGGTGSRSESFEHPAFRPDRYEAGTLNLHGIAGTWGALQGLSKRGLLGDEKRRLAGILIAGLSRLAGVRVLSPADGSALLAAFTVDGHAPDTVARHLERDAGVLCRPGLQCSPAAHRHLGTFPAGAVRLSPGWGNREEEMEAAVRSVAKLLGMA